MKDAEKAAKLLHCLTKYTLPVLCCLQTAIGNIPITSAESQLDYILYLRVFVQRIV